MKSNIQPIGGIGFWMLLVIAIIIDTIGLIAAFLVTFGPIAGVGGAVVGGTIGAIIGGVGGCLAGLFFGGAGCVPLALAGAKAGAAIGAGFGGTVTGSTTSLIGFFTFLTSITLTIFFIIIAAFYFLYKGVKFTSRKLLLTFLSAIIELTPFVGNIMPSLTFYMLRMRHLENTRRKRIRKRIRKKQLLLAQQFAQA